MDAARERFRRLADEIRRGAADHQEPGRPRPAVRQHAKDGEQVGPALQLVDDDQAAQLVQHEARVFQQPIEVGGAFEVQPMRPARILAGDLTSEGRLADLTRPQDRDDRKRAKPPQDLANMFLPGYHGA